MLLVWIPESLCGGRIPTRVMNASLSLDFGVQVSAHHPIVFFVYSAPVFASGTQARGGTEL